jgi:uridine kinase
MIGDVILIDDYHIEAGNLILDYLKKINLKTPFAISISGESGCGKTEIGQVLKNEFGNKGLKVIVLGQDDYFKLPPHSNHEHRNKDISWVGPGEVKLNLLNEHIKTLKLNNGLLEKPLIHFENDTIGKEVVTGPFDVIIAEGTYTALLEDVDVRVFIDRDYKDTKKHRLSRNRDQALEDNEYQDLSFLENVLQIEHKIISQHKKLAHLIIPPPAKLMTEDSISG